MGEARKANRQTDVQTWVYLRLDKEIDGVTWLEEVTRYTALNVLTATKEWYLFSNNYDFIQLTINHFDSSIIVSNDENHC